MTTRNPETENNASQSTKGRDDRMSYTEENEQLMTELTDFAQSFELDPAFDSALQSHFSNDVDTSSRPVISWGRWLSTSAAAVLLMVVVIVAFPPARTFALNMLAQLFPTAPEETVSIEYNEFNAAREFESIETLQTAVPFSPVTPEALPPGPVQEAFVYFPERNVTMQRYSLVDRTYSLSQQPLANATTDGLLAQSFDLQIPPSANVRTVKIGDATGELLRGFWVESGDDGAYEWSNNFWRVNIRWQDADFVYEIAVMPRGGRITREELMNDALDFARAVASSR